MSKWFKICHISSDSKLFSIVELSLLKHIASNIMNGLSFFLIIFPHDITTKKIPIITLWKSIKTSSSYKCLFKLLIKDRSKDNKGISLFISTSCVDK